MKIFLGIIIIILLSFVGYLLSNKLTKRKNYYKSFNNFNDRLKNEIGFSKNSLLNLFDEENDFNNSLKLLLKGEKINKISYLSKDESDFLIKYAKNIGKSDKNTQIDYINKCKDSIDKLYNESIENEKKYKTLYVKLGFLIGLIIFILLI